MEDFFVSPTGNDANDGTKEKPFATIGKGISRLRQQGDTLNLRGGVYVGPIVIEDKHGQAMAPITIRAFEDEAVYIDGSLPNFRSPNNDAWEPASSVDDEDDKLALPDEYVSTASFPQLRRVNRGAFLGVTPYTRLITYSTIEDLRATNETFERLTEGDPTRPGFPIVTDKDGNVMTDEEGRPNVFYPWVYMGPGIHFENGRIHIRLAHTHNAVPGVVDYTGETDPRRLALAITPEDMTTLFIKDCNHLVLSGLTIQFGGRESIRIEDVTNVQFDHVHVRATTIGVRLGGEATDVKFDHCQFDGGLPTWYFRTDRKAEYHFRRGPNDTRLPPPRNNLGKQTGDRLVETNRTVTNLTMSNCEFTNGHDAAFFDGPRVDFHHNWIDNIQDDGVAVGFGKPEGERGRSEIHDNVITRTKTCFSFYSGNQFIHWLIYRNLIDQRGETLVVRPRKPDDPAAAAYVGRSGQLYKNSGNAVGPHDIYHNTILAYDQNEHASFLHYDSTQAPHRRRSFNNIFVAVNPRVESDQPITIVPPPTFPAATDGNVYHRMGFAHPPAFRFYRYKFGDDEGWRDGGVFADLEELRDSDLFEQSKDQYPPGYENSSDMRDPEFRRMQEDGSYRRDDDLRPADSSDVFRMGIELPDDLPDSFRDQSHPAQGAMFEAADLCKLVSKGESVSPTATNDAARRRRIRWACAREHRRASPILNELPGQQR